MAQLLGEYECKIDPKSRMRLPSGLISQLGEEKPAFVINRGFENCLILYPEKVWEEISKEVNGLNQYDRRNRDFVRYFYRGAQRMEVDGADRILISKRLLEYAGIGNDVILVAVNDRIEIWAKDKYDRMLDDEPADFSDLAQVVLGDKKAGKDPE
ncbi:MAG: division/cell wall cluster transcriptional repressor MraZ [Saprospirales bacterium]|jgi:MraZ protein|nr:division/cell wall cluster transcriptional repressor MraZ [Saprospirales bacterium]MBK6903795.1 division/cell wall cluster transcriptional repressor MraZ [Saprospirales bacterium]